MSNIYSKITESTMAERRMFSRKIVKSDWFVSMPQTAQNLYWHLNMEADDDGFVSNTLQIMRMVGSSEDDLKILISKRFLMPFDNGLMLIKHWLIHNYIQSDRYHPTTHQKERESVLLKNNGVYSFSEGVRLNDVVSKMYTQARLGKVRLGKTTTKKRSEKEQKDLEENFARFWSEYPRKVGKQNCYAIFNRKGFDPETVVKMIETVRKYKNTDQWKRGFIPHPSTFLNRGQWEDEVESLSAPNDKNKEAKSYG